MAGPLGRLAEGQREEQPPGDLRGGHRQHLRRGRAGPEGRGGRCDRGGGAPGSKSLQFY